MKLFSKLITAVGLLSVSAYSYASTASASDPFAQFAYTVNSWATGGYGTGVSIASILIGGGIAAAKNSPMPAVAGIGLAALMHWGPGAVMAIMGTSVAGAIILV